MLFGKYINKYYLKYGWLLLIGVAALFLVDYFQLKVPEFYRYVIDGMDKGVVIIDGVAHDFNLEFLFEYVCNPLLIVIAVMVCGRFLWRTCFFNSAIWVETDLRKKMFDRCKNLSQEYYSRNKVGNLMSLFTNDIDTINECFGWGVLMLGDVVMLGGLSLVKMAKMDITLTLLSLIPLALMLAMGIVVSKYMMKKWEERQEAYSALSDFSQEGFSGIAVIKAFVKEFKELSAFKRLNKNNENANVTYVKYSMLLNIFITLFVESVTCVILGYGGYLVYVKTFTAGELIEFIGYFNSIIWPIMAISDLIEMTSRGYGSLKRISELLDTEPTVVDAADVEDAGVIKGDIEFKNLTFAYPGGDYEVLKDVSFKIDAGESVGIIGKTGCGKTTIVDLILRVYDVPRGTVFIDGKDVTDITIKSIRENIAYVPQDNFLFSDTIANNIAFAGDDSSESIENSARLADVHDNISEFPEGYKTVLGERGVTVSGGQKQRISIARAINKNAPALILDDSVSAVDSKTESAILNNLAENRKGRTTILIAHRISTVEGFDKIIYMDEGRIIDVGKHEELLSRCEPYKKAVELQKIESEGEKYNA